MLSLDSTNRKEKKKNNKIPEKQVLRRLSSQKAPEKTKCPRDLVNRLLEGRKTRGWKAEKPDKQEEIWLEYRKILALRQENPNNKGLEGRKTEAWKTGRPGLQEERGLEDRKTGE